MTNFSTNQVMQFYVVANGEASVTPVLGENAAIIKFEDGRVSDKIENVEWIKTIMFDALTKRGKKVTITTDKVIKGQDYVVRVSYPEVAGLGVEGWTTKVATAHATTENATDLYEEIVTGLKAAFAVDGVLTVEVSDGIVIEPVVDTTTYVRGLRPVTITDFKVDTNLITKYGELVDWAEQEVAESAKAVVENGFELADMEYFAMGERGDQYRMMGYPDVIATKYSVIPENAYNVAVIHFAYKGANETSYKSEKDIILVSVDGRAHSLATAIASTLGIKYTLVDATGKETVKESVEE